MFIGFGPEVGYKVFSASGVFNDSGKAQVIYAWKVLSGGTLSQPCIYDGVSSLGTGAIPHQGVASQWTSDNLGAGVVLPLGAFVSFDSNSSKIIVYGRQAIT